VSANIHQWVWVVRPLLQISNLGWTGSLESSFCGGGVSSGLFDPPEQKVSADESSVAQIELLLGIRGQDLLGRCMFYV
jgi:hypothetical protein